MSLFNQRELVIAMANLRRLLTERLDVEELRNICFDLGVNFDLLRGDNMAAWTRELIRYLQRRNRLPELITWLREYRPDIELSVSIMRCAVRSSSPATSSDRFQDPESLLKAAFSDERYKTIANLLSVQLRRDLDEFIRDYVLLRQAVIAGHHTELHG